MSDDTRYEDLTKRIEEHGGRCLHRGRQVERWRLYDQVIEIPTREHAQQHTPRGWGNVSALVEQRIRRAVRRAGDKPATVGSEPESPPSPSPPPSSSPTPTPTPTPTPGHDDGACPYCGTRSRRLATHVAKSHPERREEFYTQRGGPKSVRMLGGRRGTRATAATRPARQTAVAAAPEDLRQAAHQIQEMIGTVRTVSEQLVVTSETVTASILRLLEDAGKAQTEARLLRQELVDVRRDLDDMHRSFDAIASRRRRTMTSD